MKKIYAVRQMIVSLIVFLFLIGVIFKNQLMGKIIISPFLVCSFAVFGENLFLLLNKEKISIIFKYIFRISFFTYVFGFLIYTTYYALANKTYWLLLIVALFVLVIINFFKKYKK